MKNIFLIITLAAQSLLLIGQQWVESPMAHCENPEFNRKVSKLLNFSVDVIGVDDIKDKLDNYTLLDIREEEEYNVSHIPGASFFGDKDPNWDMLAKIDKDEPIILYCSIGYRSEKMGEKLMERGFTNVRNLYGSIFEWANKGLPMENAKGETVPAVHGYNKRWSKWVNNTDIDVTY